MQKIDIQDFELDGKRGRNIQRRGFYRTQFFLLDSELQLDQVASLHSICCGKPRHTDVKCQILLGFKHCREDRTLALLSVIHYFKL